MKRVAAVGLGLAACAVPATGTWAAPAANPTIRVSQDGTAKPWLGKYYWVSYPGAGSISGSVSTSDTGVPVQLQASRFPFTHGFRRVSTTTSGSSGRFTFQVRPTLATRYRVTSGGVTSRTLVFYVNARSRTTSQTLCAPGATTCHARASYTNWIPRSVGPREAGLKSYFYRGLTRNGSTPPPAVHRNSSFTLTHSRATRSKWTFHVAFTFRPRSSQWFISWATCSREIESKDGFGLPVHTGCGSSSLPNDAARLRLLD